MARKTNAHKSIEQFNELVNEVIAILDGIKPESTDDVIDYAAAISELSNKLTGKGGYKDRARVLVDYVTGQQTTSSKSGNTAVYGVRKSSKVDWDGVNLELPELEEVKSRHTTTTESVTLTFK